MKPGIRGRWLAVCFASLFAVGTLLVNAWAADPPPTALPQPVVKVFKSPSCGCCGKWVLHMRASGFTVEVTDVADVAPIKAKSKVPAELSSCHTALVGGYVIEGHVPASDVRRLLMEHPAILGLAAPGMPQGSPGMDVPGSPAYEVLAIERDGNVQVYATHQP